MSQTATSPFAGGLFEVTSDITGIPLDRANSLLGSVHATVWDRVVKACEQHIDHSKAPDYLNQSTVSYSSAHTAGEVSITITVRLTIFKAGLEKDLRRILAHNLVELHQLPDLAVEEPRSVEELISWFLGEVAVSTLLSVNPFGDLLSSFGGNSRGTNPFQGRVGSFRKDSPRNARRSPL